MECKSKHGSLIHQILESISWLKYILESISGYFHDNLNSYNRPPSPQSLKYILFNPNKNAFGYCSTVALEEKKISTWRVLSCPA